MFDFNTETGLVRMYGLFGGFADMISKDEVAVMLDEMDGRDLTIRLQSDGGSVPEGLSVMNQLRNYSGKVTFELDSMVASIATVVMMSGDRIIAEDNTTVMIHRAWTIAAGDAGEFRQVAEVLEKLDGDIAATYERRTGVAASKWMEWMAAETYFGKEKRGKVPSAAEVNLVDEFREPTMENKLRKPVASPLAPLATLNPAVSPEVYAKLRTMRMRIRTFGG